MVWLCSLLSTASLRNFSSKLRNASPAKKLRRSSGRQIRLTESWPRDDQHSFCSFAVIKLSHCKVRGVSVSSVATATGEGA